jgi:peptidyl-prolyl cis-trans isomerase C
MSDWPGSREFGVVYLGLCVGLGACNRGSSLPADKTSPPAPTKTLSATASIELPPGSGPVAVVNGHPISRSRFYRQYLRAAGRLKRAHKMLNDQAEDGLTEQLVRNLVEEELTRQQAEELDVRVQGEELQRHWEEHKKRFGSPEAFQAFLEGAGTDEEEVREEVQKALLRDRLLAALSDDVSVSESELREHYAKHPEDFRESEQVRVSHILIRVDPNARPSDRKARRDRAEEILKRIRAGEDFAALAQAFGEDGTRQRGGDLGYLARGSLVQPLESAVWSLPIGKVSNIIETPLGFHIVRKVDHKKSRMRSFPEVVDALRRERLQERRVRVAQNRMAAYRKAASIQILTESMAATSSSASGLPRPEKASP